MLPEILQPDHEITRQDAALISRMVDPDPRRGWCGRLTEDIRQALIVKLVSTLEKCRERGTDNDLKIYARLWAALARMAEIDAKAQQGPAQQNHLHLHDSFATMSQDELRAYIADRQRALAGGNGSSKAQAG